MMLPAIQMPSHDVTLPHSDSKSITTTSPMQIDGFWITSNGLGNDVHSIWFQGNRNARKLWFIISITCEVNKECDGTIIAESALNRIYQTKHLTSFGTAATCSWCFVTGRIQNRTFIVYGYNRSLKLCTIKRIDSGPWTDIVVWRDIRCPLLSSQFPSIITATIPSLTTN